VVSFPGTCPKRPLPPGCTPDNAALHSQQGCDRVLHGLFELPPIELGRVDVGLLNLLCAPALYGSDKLDIPKYLARLDRLTSYAKSQIDRGLPNYKSHPEHGNCEARWRMCNLITSVKRDFGAGYNPIIGAAIKSGTATDPLNDSRDVFINGLLDDDPKRRWGTCASIPVLVTAVARRLGYPVGLAAAGRHVYAKWEGGGIGFNIEASNPAGMTIPSDEDCRDKIQIAEHKNNPYYLRTLFPAEEFALYLSIRAECLIQSARYEESLFWSARALQLGPEDPALPHLANYGLCLALRQRMWQLYPVRKIPAMDEYVDIIPSLLTAEELGLNATISAHYQESVGDIEGARGRYEFACRINFCGHNEQRDLQRFLARHNLPPRKRPLMPPKSGPPRRIKPICPPDQEAEHLRLIAAQAEREGDLLTAQNAICDLYQFDPGDAEVFEWGRAIDRRPEFHAQLKSVIEQRRRITPKDSKFVMQAFDIH